MSSSQAFEAIRVGLLGARGYVGLELLTLLEKHPLFRVAYMSSRSHAGKRLSEVSSIDNDLRFEHLEPDAAAERDVDIVVLALPNDISSQFVRAIQQRAVNVPKMIDLSADHRFSDDWAYGLPELNRQAVCQTDCVANPGCYATAAQLGIFPVRELLSAPPAIFGVSGYSGAGTKKSEKNDPDTLRDNLLAYKLTGHIHEREVSHRLQRQVHFMPHVGAFFRGIHLTINMSISEALSRDAFVERYRGFFASEPLVEVTAEDPRVRDAVGTYGVRIGQPQVQERRAVVTVTIDNLLKGAASQALQNMNLMFGLDELSGLQIRR